LFCFQVSSSTHLETFRFQAFFVFVSPQFDFMISYIFFLSDYSEDHLENGHIFEKIIVAGWGKTRHDQEMLTEANGVYVPTPQLQKLNQNYVNTDNISL